MLSRIQDWDNRMLDRISKLRTKRLNKIMVGATTIGNSGLVWFVLAIALLPFQKYRTSGIAIIIAIIVSWLCNSDALFSSINCIFSYISFGSLHYRCFSRCGFRNYNRLYSSSSYILHFSVEFLLNN